VSIIGQLIKDIDQQGNIGPERFELVPTEPVEPPVDPVEPTPVPPIYVGPAPTNPIYVSAEGSDSNDGREPGTAVATHSAAKRIAWEMVRADASKVPSFLFRDDDEFEPFGDMMATDGQHWDRRDLQGHPDEPVIFGRYGNGKRPVFNGGGFQSSGNKGGCANIELRGLRVNGGSLLSLKSTREGCKIVDCVGRDATVTVKAPESGGRFDGFEMVNTIISDVVRPGTHHHLGLYLWGVDGWSVRGSNFYRVGWNGSGPDAPDSELQQNVRAHCVYVSGTCSPGDIDNTILAFSGGGNQYRTGGKFTRNAVLWSARPGLTFGITQGGFSGDNAWSGEVTGSLFAGNGHGEGSGKIALDMGDVDGVGITGNTFQEAIRFNALAGPNDRGGQWNGVNRTVVTRNKIAADIHLQNDGWGYLGGDGLRVHDNDWDGQYKEVSYSDLRGAVDRGWNDSGPLALPIISHTAELASEIRNGLSAADLIERFAA